MPRFLLTVLTFFLCQCGFGQVATTDTALVRLIDKMAYQDQKIQEDFIKAGSDSMRRQTEKEIQKTFAANCIVLKNIVAKHGYPGFDLVGKESSHRFWLLVQHCDADLDFQKLMLEQMQQEVKKDNAGKSDFAYLVDRVNSNQGKPQVYGTQVEVKDILTGYTPKLIADPEKVNKRRQEMGLPPLEEYLKKMNDMFYAMNKEKIEQEKLKRQKQ